jgi:hypothetical protein
MEETELMAGCVWIRRRGPVLHVTALSLVLGIACALATHTATLGAPAMSLEYFRAVRAGSGVSVILEWGTLNEYDTIGFNLYRQADGHAAPGERLNSSLIAGCGGCPAGAEYAFDDMTILVGTPYYYWLADVDIQGIEHFYATTEGPRPFVVGDVWTPAFLRGYTALPRGSGHETHHSP